MAIEPKTLAIMQAMGGSVTGETQSQFAPLKTKAAPEAPKQPVAQLAPFEGDAAPHAPCKPHDGMASAPAPTINPVSVTPICDTGPIVAENIRLGFQMAIDMLAAVNAMQNGVAVPTASQFTGNRLP